MGFLSGGDSKQKKNGVMVFIFIHNVPIKGNIRESFLLAAARPNQQRSHPLFLS